MTNKEAIKILEGLAVPVGAESAFDMAIEALQNKPTHCDKCIHVKSCRKVIILKNRTYKLIKYCSQGAERREP